MPVAGDTTTTTSPTTSASTHLEPIPAASATTATPYNETPDSHPATTSTSTSTAVTPTELILLGTGTSGCIPVVACLTAPEPTCMTCTSHLPQNKRLNTSALFRINNSKNLLVDCGKTFYTTALRWFPKYKIRRIDALVLTHAHADAYFGLDDLRAWTLGEFVQPWIDVYCTQATLDEIERTFPYLVNKAFATGGGDVADFKWHILEEDKPFTVDSCDGVEVIPLPVEHGRDYRRNIPYMSLGFRVGDYSYISDCNAIPSRTTELVNGSNTLVLDALRWEKPHASHFSIEQAQEYVRDGFQQENRPKTTWLTGFTHSVEHVATTKDCKEWGSSNGVEIAPGWDGMRIGFDGKMIGDEE